MVNEIETKDIINNQSKYKKESAEVLLKRLESIDDVMLSIFSFFFSKQKSTDKRQKIYTIMDVDSVRNAMYVSKRWYRVANNKLLWRNVDLISPYNIDIDNDHVTPLNDKLFAFSNLQLSINSPDDKIFKARKRSTGKLYSIKAPINLSDKPKSSSLSTSIMREIAMDCKIRGVTLSDKLVYFDLPTLLHFHEGQLLRHYDYIGFTLYDLLHEYVNKSASIPSSVVSKLMKQLLEGISILHERGIIHCNLIPKNIYLKGYLDTCTLSQLQVVICDFAYACDIFDSDKKSKPFTKISASYKAPELYSFNKYFCCSYAVDIWSIGCIFAEMLNSCNCIFNAESSDLELESEFHQLESIIEILGNCENIPFHPSYQVLSPFQRMENVRKKIPDIEKVEASLLIQLLELNPKSRVSASDALRHSYFYNADQTQAISKIIDTSAIPSLEISTVNQYTLTPTQHLLQMENDTFRPSRQAGFRALKAHLVDWQIEVVNLFDLDPRCVHLAMDYFERFGNQLDIPLKRHQITGAACFHVASKCEKNVASTTEISITDLLFCADNTFKEEFLLQVENAVLKVINFQLCNPIVFDFVTLFLEDLKPSLTESFHPNNDTMNMEKVICMARYISDLALQSDLHRTCKPSLIAACVVSLALYSLGQGRDVVFSTKLHQVSGYESGDMQDCMIGLWASIESIRTSLPNVKMIFQRYNNKEKWFVSKVRILDPNNLF